MYELPVVTAQKMTNSRAVFNDSSSSRSLNVEARNTILRRHSIWSAFIAIAMKPGKCRGNISPRVQALFSLQGRSMLWKTGGGGGGGHKVISQHGQGRMQDFSRVVSTRAEGAMHLGGSGMLPRKNSKLEGLRHHFLQFFLCILWGIEAKYFYRYALKTSQFLIAGKTFGEDSRWLDSRWRWNQSLCAFHSKSFTLVRWAKSPPPPPPPHFGTPGAQKAQR